MKGLHPIAALALLIMALLFLYLELQQLNPGIVASAAKTHARRHQKDRGGE